MALHRLALWTLAALTLTAVVPLADACIQVYPYSELCRGNVIGFVQGLLP